MFSLHGLSLRVDDHWLAECNYQIAAEGHPEQTPPTLSPASRGRWSPSYPPPTPPFQIQFLFSSFLSKLPLPPKILTHLSQWTCIMWRLFCFHKKGGAERGGGSREPPTLPTMPLQIRLRGHNLRGAHTPSEDGLRDKQRGSWCPVATHVHAVAAAAAAVRHYRTDARWRSAERQWHSLPQPIYLHLHMCWLPD